MRALAAKIKPKSGYAPFLHIALVLTLPLFCYVLLRMQFSPLLPISVILLSKWRMFAVRPRYWAAIIRYNAVDIIVGISIIDFMSASHSPSASQQLFWVAVYGAWLLFIKPGSSIQKMSVQAAIAQVFGLTALFISFDASPTILLTIAVWAICYLSARHFFGAFDEDHASLLAHMWGYFGAALVWVLGHWLLFYNFVAQPTLIITIIGYSLATLYYLDHQDRLSNYLKKQFVFILIAIVVVILGFSNWGPA